MSDETPCEFCGRPAEYLCDYPLGMHIGEGYLTCDAAICEECKTHRGTICASGEKSWTETEDYCPDHMDSQHPDLVRRKMEGGIRVISTGEAVKRRALNARRREAAARAGAELRGKVVKDMMEAGELKVTHLTQELRDAGMDAWDGLDVEKTIGEMR